MTLNRGLRDYVYGGFSREVGVDFNGAGITFMDKGGIANRGDWEVDVLAGANEFENPLVGRNRKPQGDGIIIR